MTAIWRRPISVDILNAIHANTTVCSVGEGWVTGTTRPVHIGRSTHVWHIELANDKGQKTCVSRITMAILPPES